MAVFLNLANAFLIDILRGKALPLPIVPVENLTETLPGGRRGNVFIIAFVFYLYVFKGFFIVGTLSVYIRVRADPGAFKKEATLTKGLLE